jgi:tetratricopeptide (TPR) repeat protein
MPKPLIKIIICALVLISNSTFAQYQNDTLSKSEYAAALTKHIPTLYYQQNWQKLVEDAQKARLLDSNAYIQNIRWEQIGTARFKLNDYRGALEDFNRFILKETKNKLHDINLTNQIKIYKANAHYYLGQKEEAAKTHLYFAKNNMGGLSSVQQAAFLYKELGNEIRFRQLIDSAATNYQLNIDENSKRKTLMLPTFMMDYAEVLLMADKPAIAIEILNKLTANVYSKEELAIKSYLSSTAQYLINPFLFEQISINNDIAVNGKITNWYFGMFNSWIASSDFSAIKKGQLFNLQQIAK